MVVSLSPAALRFAYMQVLSLHTAEDIVQVAFAKVWAYTITQKTEPDFKQRL